MPTLTFLLLHQYCLFFEFMFVPPTSARWCGLQAVCPSVRLSAFSSVRLRLGLAAFSLMLPFLPPGRVDPEQSIGRPRWVWVEPRPSLHQKTTQRLCRSVSGFGRCLVYRKQSCNLKRYANQVRFFRRPLGWTDTAVIMYLTSLPLDSVSGYGHVTRSR